MLVTSCCFSPPLQNSSTFSTHKNFVGCLKHICIWKTSDRAASLSSSLGSVSGLTRQSSSNILDSCQVATASIIRTDSQCHHLECWFDSHLCIYIKKSFNIHLFNLIHMIQLMHSQQLIIFFQLVGCKSGESRCCLASLWCLLGFSWTWECALQVRHYLDIFIYE